MKIIFLIEEMLKINCAPNSPLFFGSTGRPEFLFYLTISMKVSWIQYARIQWLFEINGVYLLRTTQALFCEYSERSPSGLICEMFRYIPVYAQDPISNSHTCSSNGKYVTSILHIVLNTKGTIHRHSPSL